MFDLVLMTMLALDAAPRIDVSRPDGPKLKENCERLLASLNPQDVSGQHPRVVAALKAQDSATKIEALRALAQTADPHALPLLVPHLESEDPSVRIWAGAAVSQLVEHHTLRRRDPKFPDRV